MDLDLYLKQLEELVNLDSGSRNAAGITQVADRLSQWYRELGWNVETIPLCQETGPVLLITNRQLTIMMSCSLDIWIRFFRMGRRRNGHSGLKGRIITAPVLEI